MCVMGGDDVCTCHSKEEEVEEEEDNVKHATRPGASIALRRLPFQFMVCFPCVFFPGEQQRVDRYFHVVPFALDLESSSLPRVFPSPTPAAHGCFLLDTCNVYVFI